jgi:hygromycin-B 4-O-kinase
VVPSLAAALEAMRTADISATTGFGGWGSDGNAPKATWSEHLLAVNRDAPDRRTYGWRQRLATFSPQGEAAFARGYDLLQTVVTDFVPRCLLHCDLINRNVLVDNEKIAGVFDWGCSLYGDHLYELAWFEFWAPWSPQLDVPLLRTELEKRWGYAPEDKEARLMACYLHIGLDHLAYNAYLGDWETLLATAERMKDLVAADR